MLLVRSLSTLALIGHVRLAHDAIGISRQFDVAPYATPLRFARRSSLVRQAATSACFSAAARMSPSSKSREMRLNEFFSSISSMNRTA